MEDRPVNLAGHEHGGTRDKASTQRFGHHDHVRIYSVTLPGEESAGTPHPGLHFIQNEQGTVLVTEGLHPGKIAGRRPDDTRLSRDRFQNTSTNFLEVQQFLNSRQVSEGDLVSPAQHWTEALPPEAASHQGKRTAG